MKHLQKLLDWMFKAEQPPKPLSRIEILAHLKTQRLKNNVDKQVIK